MDAASPLVIEGLVLELLAEASRKSLRRPDRQLPQWLYQAKELLHERFSESLTLSSISKALGIHPVHLSREFHKQFGSTIGEYLRQLRIEYACRQISTSNTPLARIALAAGFWDQSHLGRVFKERFGMTPSEYRDSFNRKAD
jgi:AraC family transcriptional regulator